MPLKCVHVLYSGLLSSFRWRLLDEVASRRSVVPHGDAESSLSSTFPTKCDIICVHQRSCYCWKDILWFLMLSSVNTPSIVHRALLKPLLLSWRFLGERMLFFVLTKKPAESLWYESNVTKMNKIYFNPIPNRKVVLIKTIKTSQCIICNSCTDLGLTIYCADTVVCFWLWA